MATTNTNRPAVSSIRHAGQTRPNIPTEELRDFVAEAEAAPTTLLYPRDPSLDPQLVWKGKDEQDRADLAVPVVPVYIQEKIHPEALIAGLAAEARARAAGAGSAIAEEAAAYQIDLFDDFDDFGEDFDRKVAFYEHDQQWTNRMILGDSLLVMASLAEKEGLKGQVQCIYLDPPYGIDFKSNWQVSTRKPEVREGKAEDVTRQPEQVQAFRDTWKLGIHSYLAYLKDRLIAARDLLVECGSLFVQIGEDNIHLVRCLLDEVFGNGNFVSQISYTTSGGFSSSALSRAGDYILWYAKSLEQLKYRELFLEKPSPFSDGQSKYDQLELRDGIRRPLSATEKQGTTPPPVGARVFRLDNMISQGYRKDTTVNYTFDGTSYFPGNNNHWKANAPQGMDRLATSQRLVATRGGTLPYVRYFDDFPLVSMTNLWDDIGGGCRAEVTEKYTSFRPDFQWCSAAS